MENNKEIKYSFNLFSSNDKGIQFLKFIYRTEEIINSTTTDEIEKNTENYLKQTIEKYNNYPERHKKIIGTNYKLLIGRKSRGKNGVFYTIKKYLKELQYIIRGEEKILSINQNNNLFSGEIKPNFYIFVEAKIFLEDYIYAEFEFVLDDPPTDIIEEPEEPEEKTEEYNTKQSIHTSECVICLNNKPNILYFECGHIAVCDSCDSIGKLRKCPICRRKIKNQRIKI